MLSSTLLRDLLIMSGRVLITLLALTSCTEGPTLSSLSSVRGYEDGCHLIKLVNGTIRA